MAQGQGAAEAGRRSFESRCAGCHGLDGRGGERAPDIARNAKVRAHTDAELRKIIHDGVPGAGMPSFRMLDERSTQELVNYLRVLQGKGNTAVMGGNPARGREVFFGAGRCGECHMIRGKGGFLAADLTEYSRAHTVEEMRQGITAPEITGWGSMVEVRTRDGKRYSGVLRNEDNFSLQLQTEDGAFLLLSKGDVEQVSRADGSVHRDLGNRLSAADIRDVMSYLVRVGGPARKEKKEADFEE